MMRSIWLLIGLVVVIVALLLWGYVVLSHNLSTVSQVSKEWQVWLVKQSADTELVGNVQQEEGVIITPEMDVVEVINRLSQLSTFSILINQVLRFEDQDQTLADSPLSLTQTLTQATSSVTVFAPSNVALEQHGVAEVLVASGEYEAIKKFILRHVVAEKYDFSDLLLLSKVTSMQGIELQVLSENNFISIEKSQVVGSAITTSNGILYEVDAVIE